MRYMISKPRRKSPARGIHESVHDSEMATKHSSAHLLNAWTGFPLAAVSVWLNNLGRRVMSLPGQYIVFMEPRCADIGCFIWKTFYGDGRGRL